MLYSTILRIGSGRCEQTSKYKERLVTAKETLFHVQVDLANGNQRWSVGRYQQFEMEDDLRDKCVTMCKHFHQSTRALSDQDLGWAGPPIIMWHRPPTSSVSSRRNANWVGSTSAQTGWIIQRSRHYHGTGGERECRSSQSLKSKFE